MTKSTTRIAALAFALAGLFVCAARADVRELVNAGKVSWSSNATVIYLNADGTPATADAYDHLVLKFTDTTAAGSFTIADGIKGAARVLLVGGGGAGGSGGGTGNNRGAGGGGGGGGFLEVSNVALESDTTYSITVGAGGEPQPAESKKPGGNGASSLFQLGTTKIYEAFGGGGGGAECDGVGGDNLGSGGGGSREYVSSAVNHVGGVCTTGQGNNGGAGTRGQTAGGGGGAGGAGLDGGDNGVSTPAVNIGGKGGDGRASDIICTNGVSATLPLYYAGGGGGGTRSQTTETKLGPGGLGGGGRGAGGNDFEALPGDPNTGGGGGGGTCTLTVSGENKSKAGAAGGSGVVIVRITQLVDTQVALPTIAPLTFNKDNQIALDFGIAYTYVSGTTNATEAGTYSFVVKPGPDLEWNAAAGGGTGEKTVNWSISKRTLAKPTAATGLVYDGTEKVGVTYEDADLTEYCTFDASSVTNATNAGDYTYSVSLNDTVNTMWSDNSTEAVAGTWTISPQTVAVPTPKTGLVYDGNEKQGFASLDYEHYQLTAGETNATAGGTHQFTFALRGNNDAVNYVWDTDPVSSAPYSGEWTITPAANEVTVSMAGWRINTTPNEPKISATWGSNTVQYAYGLGENASDITDWVDNTSLINTDGVWTVMAMIPPTANWNGATNTAQFTVWDTPVKLFRDHVDIKVTPPAGSSETFINFAALVKISENKYYGFKYSDAGDDGKNLMFLPKGSEEPLPFEVDTWRTTGESLVWVLIPELPPAGTTITMYWNLKEGRTPPPNNPEEVWPFYSGVWHMNESITTAQAATALSYDSTTNKNNATPTKGANGNLGQMVSTTGFIGNARVNSSSTPLAQGNRLQTAKPQTFNGVFTFSGWFKMTAKNSYPRLAGTKLSTIDGKGWSVEIAQNSSTSLYLRGNNNSAFSDIAVNDILNWVYLTFVYNNNTASVYSNGKFVKSGNITKVEDTTQPLVFGGQGAPSSGNNEYSFYGSYDEIRIVGQALSAARIAAEYATVVSNDFTVQGSSVSHDDAKFDYWVSLPAMDKTDWDVNDAPGVITNAGSLAFSSVSNYIYSVYDPTQTFESTTSLTNAGYYRVVFVSTDPDAVMVPTGAGDYEGVSYTIDIHVIESQPYTDIGGNGGDSGRVLLMNNHTKDPNAVDVDYQGWYDADNTEQIDGKKAFAGKSDTVTFWHHLNLTAPSVTDYNLKHGTMSTLYTKNYGSRLWDLYNCRHGNTFPTRDKDSLNGTQNYLPWKATYSRRINAHNTLPGSRSTTGQLVMQNTTDAVVYSSCFTNGIGTIYFDAVNGWSRPDENYDGYKLVVEIATNTVAGLAPTDENSVEIVTATNIIEDVEVITVTTNLYGYLEGQWKPAAMIPFKRDGTANFEKCEKTEELTLDVQNGGTMDNFFRVVVPVDISGPVRFRIRRATRDTGYTVDGSSFILLDNIIASIPAMRGDLVSAGHYDEAKSGLQTLGWELATSVPYPSSADTNLLSHAKPVYTVNVGDGSTPDTSTFFASATMHYRWRYLNQQFGEWKTADLVADNGFKSLAPLDLPGRVGDVEYWFEYRSQAPYYKYVDYSGASNASIAYTEDRGVLTNRLGGATLASGGTDWYFRLREGKSDYSGLDIVYRRGESAAEERVHMLLFEDRVWRGFVQTKENQAGEIKYHIEALDHQTAEFAEYAATTNYFVCRTDNPRFPVSDSLVAASEGSWSTLTLDATTGYVMFQIDETSKALTVVHADYQNANGWSDALARKDSQGRGPIFVGTSTTNSYKIGVSPSKQTFNENFGDWQTMPNTNETWMFVTGLTDIKPNHMYGRKTYDTFASDTNGLWEVGQGQWIAKKYRDDRDNAGVALQMGGYGKGYLQFTDAAKAPRGLESVSFNARLTQDIQFDDFAYYFGGNEGILNLQNYTFMVRTAFDRNSNKDFTGNASLSVVANYLPNKGCYEARWEWLGNNNNAKRGQRLCLYRWNVIKGVKEPELIIAKTNTVVDANTVTALANNDNNKYTPLFISVSNDVPNNCTWVVAGIRRAGTKLGDSPLKNASASANWLGVCFKDTDSKRLIKGSYGVLSANCPGVLARPEFSHTTQTTVGKFPGNGKTRDAYENENLAQVNDLKNVVNCAQRDLKDADYPGWNIIPERNTVEFTDTSDTGIGAVIGSAPAQDLHIFLGTAGRGDWGPTPYKTINIDGFGGDTFNVPLYSTKDCSVRFAVGSGISDVAIDSVQLKQWRGGNWDDPNVWPLLPAWADDQHRNRSVGHTNFVFTSAWTTNHTVLLSAKRARLEEPSSIRSPLMDGFADDGTGGSGYIRGKGLGMISIEYKNADENAWLELQIITNNVSYTTIGSYDKTFGGWTTVTNFNFATMTAAQRKSGILNTYLGLHDVKGAMRLVVSTNAIKKVANVTDTSKFGEVTITAIACSDEPAVDVHSWWGWNLRTVGGDEDSERKMLLGDFATGAGEAGLSIALNNSVDANYSISRIEVSDRESYIQHKPFVQTPTFTSNIVGEVSFRARKYEPSDPVATVAIYGSKNASETDDGKWDLIPGAVFMISNSWYETYTCKMDSRYKAFRLAVAGVEGVVETADGGGNGLPPGANDPPPRVLLDELYVCEAINAIMGFKNVGCFRHDMSGLGEVPNVPSAGEQPLCEEAWGVQCEIYGAQLASDIDFSHTPRVKLYWYEGIYPWGFENWRDSANAHSAWLSRAIETEEDRYVYRSSMRTSPDAIVPMSLTAPTYVQYMLEVVFYTKENPTVPMTNLLTVTDWQIPEWYKPLDLNAEYGQGGDFAAYNILDNIAPSWAWINEVNIFGDFKNWANTDDNCQFVEIAHPPEADVSGWQVRLLEPHSESNYVITNVLARFGSNGLAGTKQMSAEDAEVNMVFRVIGSPLSRSSGRLKKSEGTLDAVWSVDNPTLVFTSDGVVSYYDPVIFQLVRTSGIIEHEIIVEGTNYLESLEIESPDYIKEVRDFVTNLLVKSTIPIPGYDYGGPSNSLSVIQNFGHNGMEEPENDWTMGVKMTPGHRNIGQVIDPNHPVPAGEEVLVYFTVTGDHILQSLDGSNFTNGMFSAIVSKGNPVGTNVVYRVDPWYVLGSVRTGTVSLIDQAVQTKATQPYEYTLSGVAKGTSNNVTVVAAAALNPKFGTDWGVPEDDPYRDAIIDWLERGTDLYGNPFGRIDSGEIKLANYRSWWTGQIVTNLTLREMYWLDMDPTIGNLSLIGGITVDPHGVEHVVSQTIGDSTVVMTNRRVNVYMMISNENATVEAPAHPRGINDFTTHWTPYVLRGLEPGEHSQSYVASTGDWNSVTFKITGMLMNGYTSFDNVDNKVPLRHFTFNEDSFGADGLSKIEVYDPYSSLSLGYNAGWKRWWDKNGYCPVVFFWMIDTRLPPIGVEQLNKDSYYGD